MTTRRGVAALVGIILAAALFGAAPITLARFTDAAARSASFGTATLQPPTALAGTGGTSASFAWTASTSAPSTSTDSTVVETVSSV